MSADWEVESYRTEFESEEHWELRKNFMLAHKDRLPEDEIVCLAQVFTNIEFLGCRYPDETMRKVAELAKGVVESYREKKKNCLKRTFVAASDAAASKVKGLNNPNLDDENKLESAKKMRNDVKNINKNEGVHFYRNIYNQQSNFYGIHDFRNDKKWMKGSRALDHGKLSESCAIHNLKIKKLDGPFADFVLFICDVHPTNLLERNASLNKCSLSWKYDQAHEDAVICSVYLNDHLVATGEGKNNKFSRESAAREAIQKLQTSCYVVKIKAQFTSDSTVSPAELGCTAAEESTMKCNVGEQIMKLMGWTGAGLGVKQQGMIEPVTLLSNAGRSGLGLKCTTDDTEFKKKATSFIRTWLQSDSDKDLVFSSEFSIEQRKTLHELAKRFSLKSKSYGKGEGRHLVVSKNPSPWQIVGELMKVGGITSKYELIVPDTPE